MVHKDTVGVEDDGQLRTWSPGRKGPNYILGPLLMHGAWYPLWVRPGQNDGSTHRREE